MILILYSEALDAFVTYEDSFLPDRYEFHADASTLESAAVAHKATGIDPIQYWDWVLIGEL